MSKNSETADTKIKNIDITSLRNLLEQYNGIKSCLITLLKQNEYSLKLPEYLGGLDFRRYVLKKGDEKISLKSKNLSGSIFMNLDLNGLDISNSNVEDTNFTGASMNDVNIEGVDFSKSILRDITTNNSVLIEARNEYSRAQIFGIKPKNLLGKVIDKVSSPFR